jgi:hypothetical protein
MSNQTSTEENPTAGVTPAAPWRIHAVSVLPEHRLAITFRDGLTGIADFSEIKTAKNPGFYAPLADPDYFAQVQIELGALTWPNGEDLDPAWLHESLTAHKMWSVPF